MNGCAGIVLAGGRSSRMGRPKADLDWHGLPLLAWVARILGRAVDGPVVVVRAPGQQLPRLPEGVEIAEDAREGRGPLEGIAAGLRAVEGRVAAAYVSSTDVPLLHPAFVRAVVAHLDGADAAVPRVGGRAHPLAGAYRTAVLPVVDELLASDQLRAASLFDRVRVRFLDREALLADPELRAADPGLLTLRNVNRPEDYEEALAAPPPEVRVERLDAPGQAAADALLVRAATLGAAAAALAVELTGHTGVAVNGVAVAGDPELPLVAGDIVSLTPPAARSARGARRR